MAIVRLILRSCLLVVVSLVHYLPLLFMAMILPASHPKRLTMQSWVLHTWARTVRKILSMRVERIGAVPLDTGIWVSNHLSYVDIVLIASEMRTAFVAKEEVSRWPVIGHLVRLAGTVFVDRQRNRSLPVANEGIQARLQAQTSVVVFAEGSSTHGESVLPFRPPLLAIAASGNYPVHHGFISYQISADPHDRLRTRDEVCWWGDAGFFSHIVGLLKLRQFEARIVFGHKAMRDTDRKTLAQELHQAVSAQSERYNWSSNG